MYVFVLHHVHKLSAEDDDAKMIGVYSSEERARAAIGRLSSRPGFAHFPDGFHVDGYELDTDHWTEGFVTVPEAADLSSPK